MLNKSTESTFDSLIRLRSNTRNSDGTESDIDFEEVCAKVHEDINFLRGRIEHIKRSKSSRSNPVILKTYESMLASRESVLSWLQHNNSPEERSKAG